MIEGSCHCGKVRFQVEALTPAVTDFNCSICHRLGALWAYYPTGEVDFTAGAGETATYVRQGEGLGDLAFHHCPTCGCTTHWSSLIPDADRMGVNARLFDRALLDGVRVRRLDGAETWTELE
jgi:hypothetical protein